MRGWTRDVNKRLPLRPLSPCGHVRDLESRNGPRGIPAQTGLQEVPRTRRQSRPEEEIEAALLLRPETPRQPPALRLPARAQRRAPLVGGAERTVARSKNEASRDA